MRQVCARAQAPNHTCTRQWQGRTLRSPLQTVNAPTVQAGRTVSAQRTLRCYDCKAAAQSQARAHMLQLQLSPNCAGAPRCRLRRPTRCMLPQLLPTPDAHITLQPLLPPVLKRKGTKAHHCAPSGAVKGCRNKGLSTCSSSTGWPVLWKVSSPRSHPYRIMLSKPHMSSACSGCSCGM